MTGGWPLVLGPSYDKEQTGPQKKRERELLKQNQDFVNYGTWKQLVTHQVT